MSILIWKKLGPYTQNYEWGPFGDWGNCTGNCGTTGERMRHRICFPPENGGYECPADIDTEVEQCEMEPCPGMSMKNYNNS